MLSFSSRPSLERLVSAQLSAWPDHERYLRRSLSERDPQALDVLEDVAQFIVRLAAQESGGELASFCSDYRYLCEQLVFPEELYFRRHKKYRLSTFAEAYRDCYSNSTVMTRYMNGLLLSNVFWRNHADVICHFTKRLPLLLKLGGHHLEVGPGHGLFLYFAALRDETETVTGWDISETSIKRTRMSLEAAGIKRPVSLILCDIFSNENATPIFDSIVLSEILEHLEDPVAALRLCKAWLRPGGIIWINVPANSPAPDHIYLVESPEAACALVTDAGLDVVDTAFYPMTGATLERAIKQKLAISCVIAARK